MIAKTRSTAYAVLDAPSNLGLRPPAPDVEPGCRRMPDALRGNGIVERLGALDAGRVLPPPYAPAWDGKTTRNEAAIARYSRELADRVGEILDHGDVPVVLGGDCSILLGSMLALRRRGRFGLLYVDGHSDFRHPGTGEPLQAVAGEDLAIVTGRGDEPLTNFEGLRPLVREEDIVALGEREGGPDLALLKETPALVVTRADVGETGLDQVIAQTLTRMQQSPAAGFWLHLDADVLDDAVMPAVDSPAPDGLSFAEWIALVRGILGSARVVGIQLTIFDPDLDPDGGIAAVFTDAIVQALGSSLHPRP